MGIKQLLNAWDSLQSREEDNKKAKALAAQKYEEEMLKSQKLAQEAQAGIAKAKIETQRAKNSLSKVGSILKIDDTQLAEKLTHTMGSLQAEQLSQVAILADSVVDERSQAAAIRQLEAMNVPVNDAILKPLGNEWTGPENIEVWKGVKHTAKAAAEFDRGNIASSLAYRSATENNEDSNANAYDMQTRALTWERDKLTAQTKAAQEALRIERAAAYSEDLAEAINDNAPSSPNEWGASAKGVLAAYAPSMGVDWKAEDGDAAAQANQVSSLVGTLANDHFTAQLNTNDPRKYVYPQEALQWAMREVVGRTVDGVVYDPRSAKLIEAKQRFGKAIQRDPNFGALREQISKQIGKKITPSQLVDIMFKDPMYRGFSAGPGQVQERGPSRMSKISLGEGSMGLNYGRGNPMGRPYQRK